MTGLTAASADDSVRGIDSSSAIPPDIQEGSQLLRQLRVARLHQNRPVGEDNGGDDVLAAVLTTSNSERTEVIPGIGLPGPAGARNAIEGELGMGQT